MSLVACSSGDSNTLDNSAAPEFRISSAFQGANRPLGVTTLSTNSAIIELLNLPQVTDTNADTIRWNIVSSEAAGHFRLTNRFAGEAFSLDIVDDGFF